MSAAVPDKPTPAEVEEYYAALWSDPSWSEAEPNEDEEARWRVMEPLVDHALAGVSTPKILDLGCGRGWLTTLLARHGEAEGIDPVAAGIERANRLFPQLRFRVADASDLVAEGAAGIYHLVVSSEVIEHVPDTEKPIFLAHAATLLAPGGYLLLTTPRGELWKAWRSGAASIQPVEEWVTERQLDRLARNASFAPVARRRALEIDPPLTWQGWLLKWILRRRIVRDLPIGPLARRLEFAAKFYQVALYRKLPRDQRFDG